MRALILTLLFIGNFLSLHSQVVGEEYVLKGYFIVSCFDTTLKSSCDLNIESTTVITGDSMTCGDGVFYKNISVIKYVNPQNIDLNKIDNFSYQIQLQKILNKN